jgi:hypothetical protein
MLLCNRYLAFYWAPPPTQSKKPSRPPSRRGSFVGGEAVRIVPPKDEKVLAGCIVAEHDVRTSFLRPFTPVLTLFLTAQLPAGNIHLCFHLPFSVGEAGLALGRLTHALCSRARLELASLNETRLKEGREVFPPLNTAWTVRASLPFPSLSCYRDADEVSNNEQV